MDRLNKSCNASLKYPLNLIDQDAPAHQLHSYLSRLNDRESKLFRKEAATSLDFWDYDVTVRKFQLMTAKSSIQTKTLLGIMAQPQHHDPRCRFVFVYARHSRDALRTTREMLMLVLSYHQVMPTFLDFLFPFGTQQYQQDFHFSGFRHESRLSDTDQGIQIPELSRSGQEIQLCYSLKSVERSSHENDVDLPWSVRQSAVYHRFDVETGQATWIVIKGDQEMKKRLKAASEREPYLDSLIANNTASAFAATLETHLILCSWAGENWRWYLNSLEEAVQTDTRHAPVAMVQTQLPRANGEPPITRVKRNLTGLEKDPVPPTQPAAPNVPTIPLQPLPNEPQSPPEVPPGPDDRLKADVQDDFSFSDLQRLQHIEEQVNDTLLVLETNMSVLAELKQHYQQASESEGFPVKLGLDSKKNLARFAKRVSNVSNDLKMQQSRAKTLLNLLANRKSLLYGILEYRNMEASKLLTRKAQLSTDNMESMTQDMQEIARKTKQETVLMRIITLVTLFFLPGTFISTLMSTDIVKWDSPDPSKQKIYQAGALQLFFSITAPLMALTFLASFGIYRYVKRDDAKSSRGKVSMV